MFAYVVRLIKFYEILKNRMFIEPCNITYFCVKNIQCLQYYELREFVIYDYKMCRLTSPNLI